MHIVKDNWFLYIRLWKKNPLPEQFIEGLTTASLQGRAQIVSDPCIDTERTGDLVFYFDGAHSPESMEVCAKWFSLAIKEDSQQQILNYQPQDNSQSSHEWVQRHLDKRAEKNSAQVESIKLFILMQNHFLVWNRILQRQIRMNIFPLEQDWWIFY